MYFAHSDHHDTYKELLLDEHKRAAVLDFAAAYAAQLQYRNFLNLQSFVKEALKFFRLGLQARGFELAVGEEVAAISRSYEETIVLVTGCQTQEVPDARVDGAYNALKWLNVDTILIILSGAYPSPGQARSVRSEKYPIEPDEAGQCGSDLMNCSRER